MNSLEYQIEVDNLALGMTKAPMFMGVNLRMFFANIVLCTLVFLDFHSFMGIPLFFINHLIMFKISIKEPNFFSIYINAFLKCPPVLNRGYWGKTNSYEPW